MKEKTFYYKRAFLDTKQNDDSLASISAYVNRTERGIEKDKYWYNAELRISDGHNQIDFDVDLDLDEETIISDIKKIAVMRNTLTDFLNAIATARKEIKKQKGNG